jgi:peptide/nickel transport system permease protein
MTIPIIWGVTIINFAMITLSPGDPVQVMIGFNPNVTNKDKADLALELNLLKIEKRSFIVEGVTNTLPNGTIDLANTKRYITTEEYMKKYDFDEVYVGLGRDMTDITHIFLKDDYEKNIPIADQLTLTNYVSFKPNQTVLTAISNEKLSLTIDVPVGSTMIIVGHTIDPDDSADALFVMTSYKKMVVPAFIERYFRYLNNLMHGDLGRSFNTREKVSYEIGHRIPLTLRLQLIGFLVLVMIAIPLGVISATRQYSKFDYTAMTASLVGYSMPAFWQALMLQLVFGVWLGWLPVAGAFPPEDPTPPLLITLKHMILPVIVLGTGGAFLTRLTRSEMLEVLRQDYVRTARAKGLAERVVIYKHAFKNVLIPFITIFTVAIATLISGSAMVEMVFQYPGIGMMFIAAAFQRDWPIIMGTSLIIGSLVIYANLVADVLYALVDPRIRY